MENSSSNNIARQCFVFGGPSVFLARSIYYTAIGTVDNSFQDYCLENYGSYKTEPTTKQPKPSVVVYPNPTNSELGLFAVSNTNAKGTLTNSISQAVIQLVIEEGFYTIKTSDLPVGIYVLSLVTDEGQSITQQIVVQ
jgi:hypothetical protein